jgi:ParB/RepB/Spo0J family partition protein
MSAVIEQTEQTTAMILTALLRPNDYNPNVMTDDEFAELVAEVRHLGRLPKPVVARPNGDGYVIVDGEHGWRAAREVGLTEVPCEVIAADDFEAMRQTYKRNQHGTHNPVQLGRMFRQMMEARGLSQRALAEDTHVSEGTIRNALEYAKAGDVRNDYAFDELSIKQVRFYNRLPKSIGILWLDSGADIKTLLEVKSEIELAEAERYYSFENDFSFGRYEWLETTGLVAFLKMPVRRPPDFTAAIKTLREWDKLEHEWARAGITRAQVREYTKHHFSGAKVVGSDYEMRRALSLLIDTSQRPPHFRLTPEGFGGVIQNAITDGVAGFTFPDYLRVAIAEKTGEVPKDKVDSLEERGQKLVSVRAKLIEIELNTEAPDYIQASSLPSAEKHALWKAQEWSPIKEIGESLEAVKRVIAQRNSIPRGEKGTSVEHAVWECLRTTFGEMKARAKWESFSEAQIARALAERLPLYDKEKDAEAITTLSGKLAELTKAELLVLEEYTAALIGWKKHVELFKAMAAKG